MKNVLAPHYDAVHRYLLILFFLSLFIPAKKVEAQLFDKFNISKDDEGRYGGTININLLQRDLTLHAPFTTQKEELTFEGILSDKLSIKDIFMQIGGQPLFSEVNKEPFSSFFGLISMPKCKFSISPFAKTCTINSSHKNGNTSLTFSKLEDKYYYSISYAPSNKFKLSGIDESLKFIDDFNIVENFVITVSNYVDNVSINSRGNVKLDIAAVISKSKFQNRIRSLIDPENKNKKDLDQILGLIPQLSLAGSLDNRFNTQLATAAGINKKFGEWEFEKIALNFQISPKTPVVFEISGQGVMPLDKTKLRLTPSIYSEPPNAIGLGFKLTSINKDKQAQEWYEPYGIPFIAFDSIGGGITVDGTTLLDNLSLNGSLKLGKKPNKRNTPDKRILGVMDIKLDAEPTQNSYYSKFKNLNLLKMIEAFKPDWDAKDMKSVLDVGINNSEFKLEDGEAVSISGDLSFFGILKASLATSIDASSGLQLKGSLDPISLKAGDLELLALNAKDKPAEGASFNIDMNATDPQVAINGQLKLLGMNVNASSIYLNSGGITSQIAIAGFGSGSLSLDMKDFFNAGKLSIQSNLSPAFGDIPGIIKSYVRKEGGAIAGEIVEFVIPQFGLKNISIGGKLDQFTTKLVARITYNAGLLGAVKEYSFNLDLPLDFSEPDKIPEITAKIIAAIGEQIIYNFGDLAAMVFNKGLEVAEKAMEEVGKTVIQVGTELAEVSKTIGRSAANTYEKLANFLDPKETYPKPNNKPPDKYVRPGFRHYEVYAVYDNKNKYTWQLYGMLGIGLNPSKKGSLLSRIAGTIFKSKTELYSKKKYYSGGSNNVLYSRNEKTLKSFSYTLKTGTKHIYVNDTSRIHMRLSNITYDKKPTILKKDVKVNLSKTIFNISKLKNGVTTFRTNQGNYAVTYYIKAHPMMTEKVLLQKIKMNDLKGLKEAIKKGGDLESIRIEAMNMAVTSGNKEVIQLLSTKFKTKTTVDHLTEVMGTDFNENLVLCVLENLGPTERPQVKHINLAIKNNESKLAHMMIRKGALPDASNLTNALKHRVYRLAREIISKNVKPTKQDLDNALRQPDFKAVEIVLPHVKPDQNAFLLGAKTNNTELFKKLIKGNKEQIIAIEPAQIAIDNKNIDILRLCINKTIKPDMVLTYAVSKNDLKGVEYCHRLGADPKPALLRAIEGLKEKEKKLEIIRSLLTCKTCPKAVDLTDPTYLNNVAIHSQKGSHTAILKLLLDNGADLNGFRDEKMGNSLLHIASIKRRKIPQFWDIDGNPIKQGFFSRLFRRYKRDHNMMQFLIDHKAHLNTKNNKGCTPLHIASNKSRKKKDLELVQKMVVQRADVNACTKRKKSILQIANGRKTKSFLKSKGAKRKACK